MLAFKEEAKKIEDRIIEWRRELHKIPEVGLDTPKTRKFIESELEKMEIDYETGYAQNGLVALIKKGEDYENYRTFAIRTDIDGLKVEEKTGLDFASRHEGKMHACGHDAHAAMALGAARIISQNIGEFDGNVKLIFQPGEEGAGGGEKMIEDGALKDPEVDAVIGLHTGGVIGCMENGQIGFKAGPMMACTDRIKMTVIGRGGHGAMPNTVVDPIAISASIIENIQTLISREISPVHPGVISICQINGGSAFNVVPDEVSMEGTARFIHEKERNKIARRMENLCTKLAESRGAEVDFEYERGYPPLVNPEEFTEFFRRECAAEILDEEEIVKLEEPVMGGEDMAYYLEKVPGIFIFLGGKGEIDGKFHGHHNSKFDIDEKVLWKGTALLVKTARRWLEKNG
ncbi:M20 metallopeptidase family protein [Halarsenatibacter silvermanii]|uniref:Peptidase dimerisation domain-containing protein n=1 Tax=Halarsenatibacter silvermanii TaxID=321763 RepID=A0A1G9HEH0_9FIRM|nr:M20 family metallopeptidase [Halarsenatibacter silvermanii]SDL11411.1 Peptidase dimerisation domain-containing protein [Halarsenatibacter silvermanii]